MKDRSPATTNPALDCLRDDMVEWLEFYGTASERLGSLLVDAERQLARGALGLAVHSLRSAKVTHSILREGFAKASRELNPECPASVPQPTPSTSTSAHLHR